MSHYHLVRVGALGHVGRFTAADGRSRRRGKRVVVRTARGLELGEVLAPPREPQAASDEATTEAATSEDARADGVLLRAMTPADEMLEKRIEAKKAEAFDRCSAAVTERRLPVTLIDVEHLFDGRGLYFYFLGAEAAEREAGPAWERLVHDLTEEYDAVVQFRQFAEAVEQGCGPTCGTKEPGSEGGCGGCATQGCAIKSACHTSTHAAAAGGAERGFGKKSKKEM